MQTITKPAGRLAGRYIRSIALSQGEPEVAIAFTEAQNWLDKSDILTVHKAAVGGMTLSDLSVNEVGVDFLAALRPVSVLGRLTAARRVPLNTRTIAFGTGTTAGVIGEGAPAPLTVGSITGVLVSPHKTVGLSVITAELLRNAKPGTDEAIAADLAAAVGAAEDVAFLNPATAGSILNGTAATASTGSTVAQIDADLGAVIAALIAGGSSLVGGAWIMSPTTASALALKRNSGGGRAYPDISILGGELLGLPVIVSASVSGYIALVDQAGVLVGEDGPVALVYARNATVQMLDNPTNNSATPTATTMVSMFQTNSVAIKAEVWRGWLARAGSAAYISGVSY